MREHMRKHVIILSLLCLTLLLCACGKGKSDSSESINLSGTWTQKDAGADSYFVLELKADGSGSLMTEPEDIGVPLNYEVDGTSIMTHMGDAEDNTPMEYIKDSDQIKYNDIYFERK